MDERYAERRRDIEQYFRPENRIAGSEESFDSPSAKFRLETSNYSTDPGAWNYSRGVVTRVADGEVIADVQRCYTDLWHAWVEHPNGREYLLCGEDYQGYSVIDLTEGRTHIHFPEAAYRGFGFCWASVYPSPDGLMLAVAGCYWRGPYDLVFYDFRQPEQLPLPEISRQECLYDISGWFDNDTFVQLRQVEVRKSDGKPYDELTKEEQASLDADDSLSGYVLENVPCERPPFPTRST